MKNSILIAIAALAACTTTVNAQQLTLHHKEKRKVR